MKIDTHTAYAVTVRLHKLVQRPPLFDDRMPPARIAMRFARVLTWLGLGGRLVVGDYICRGDVPKTGGERKWGWRDGARPDDLDTVAQCAHEFEYVRDVLANGVVGKCTRCRCRFTAWPGSVHYDEIVGAALGQKQSPGPTNLPP